MEVPIVITFRSQVWVECGGGQCALSRISRFALWLEERCGSNVMPRLCTGDYVVKVCNGGKVEGLRIFLIWSRMTMIIYSGFGELRQRRLENYHLEIKLTTPSSWEKVEEKELGERDVKSWVSLAKSWWSTEEEFYEMARCSVKDEKKSS